MRELIRPALFLVARVGLFLGVVAWVVGQTWQGVGFTPGCGAIVDQHGVIVGINTPSDRGWGGEEISGTMLVKEFLSVRDTLPGTRYWGFGAFAVLQETGSVIIAFRHWLIITIFALFYGVLKWVYRKRGTEIAG